MNALAQIVASAQIHLLTAISLAAGKETSVLAMGCIARAVKAPAARRSDPRQGAEPKPPSEAGQLPSGSKVRYATHNVSHFGVDYYCRLSF
ncbi:MAG: hypothetical protein CFK52_08080 [Chloracidobacterium sp. CP2_5A]|nr:MAG: hypothetical protein CFK52_08080 [Chloracidobacterium sp. CP2_5A]